MMQHKDGKAILGLPRKIASELTAAEAPMLPSPTATPQLMACTCCRLLRTRE